MKSPDRSEVDQVTERTASNPPAANGGSPNWVKDTQAPDIAAFFDRLRAFPYAGDLVKGDVGRSR